MVQTRLFVILGLLFSGSAFLTGCPEDDALQESLQPLTPLTALTLQQVVPNAFAFPVFLTAPPRDMARLFVVEKGGTIRIIKNNTLLANAFLDISALVSMGGEQGLLGMAFDPNYSVNRRFYVSYTDKNGIGNSLIARYLADPVDPDLNPPVLDRILLTVVQPFANHNGGMITFGPDRFLYIGLGDGGSGGDPQGHGQVIGDLLGSLLRIDVSPAGAYTVPASNPFSGPTGQREEWDLGLRNPWRFSFDRTTDDLYIADVGQNSREEITVSLAVKGGGKGLNYGWNIMEGTICFPPGTGCSSAGLTLPVLDYPHASGACSITGGYVYRGPSIPSLVGTYFYADFCAGFVRSFRFQNGQVTNQLEWPLLSPPGSFITSFGEDALGELYIMTQGGGLWRIVPN